MYITATRAFLPPFVPILAASVAVPRIGLLVYQWAIPSVSTAGAYLSMPCSVSLN